MDANENLKHAAALYGSRIAVIDDYVQLTYAQLAARVRRLAGGLSRLGVGKGDRVSVLARNCSEYLELYYAVMWRGAAVSPLNPRLTVGELSRLLSHADPKLLVVAEEFTPLIDLLRAAAPSLQDVVVIGSNEPRYGIPYRVLALESELEDVPVAASDMCILAFTGGTTGVPKGAMIPHSYLAGNALRGVGGSLAWREDEVYLHAAPMFHLADVLWIWGNTYYGGTHVVARRFQPAALAAAIAQRAVTQLFMVPTMLSILLSSPDFEPAQLATVRQIVYGGTRCSPRLIREVKSLLPHVRLTQVYAQTEATFLTVFPAQEQAVDALGAHSRIASCGRKTPGIELAVLRDDGSRAKLGEVGELVVRHSPLTMLGYWRNPEETARTVRDGFLHTGDLGYLDEDHFVYLADRKKDMIKSGGENVYCMEVEAELLRHPDVSEAVVYGVPDDHWAERVHATVVPVPGAHLDAAMLEAHCRAGLAGYKVPRHFDIVPRIDTGGALDKPLKTLLRERALLADARQAVSAE